MIVIEFKHQGSATYQLMIKMRIREYAGSNIVLGDLELRIRKDISQIPKMSGATADMYYKVKNETDAIGEHLIVYHENQKGDIDRIIALIRNDGIKPPETWFDKIFS